MSFGLQIYNGAGHAICDGENPTVAYVKDVPVTVMTGTEGTPVQGSYGMWANDAVIIPSEYPMGLLPLTEGFTSPFGLMSGYMGYIIYGAAASPVKICKPMSLMGAGAGDYGLEVFNSAGARVFDTRHRQVVVRDVVTLSAADMWSFMNTGTPIQRSHVYVASPLYIIDGFQCVYSEFGPVLCGYYGYSYWAIAKGAVKRISESTLQIFRNFVGYQRYDGSASCVAANNGSAFRSAWGTPTAEYVNGGQIYTSMWCAPTINILVCELLSAA